VNSIAFSSFSARNDFGERDRICSPERRRTASGSLTMRTNESFRMMNTESERTKKAEEDDDDEDGEKEIEDLSAGEEVQRERRRRKLIEANDVVNEEQGNFLDKAYAVVSFNRETADFCEEEDRKYVLPGRHFDVPIRIDIAHRVVRWQLARKRGVSTAKTKSRGEVSGTTRKARPQKGGGRARVGSLRAPQMRGGGTAHGPVPRDFEHKLQKKVRRLGLQVALSAKAAEGRLVIVDSLDGFCDTGKTKEFKNTLGKILSGNGEIFTIGSSDTTTTEKNNFSALIADSDYSGEETKQGILFRRGSDNIENIHVMPQVGLNVYSILKHRCLIITRKALDDLISRLDKPIKR
jgi:large subunit ribosomal protein L4